MNHILVVDDDFPTRIALQQIVEGAGYRVTCAANGREALDSLLTRTLPSLILLDLMMPVMSGWQFREEQLRQPALARIPVVVLSAETNLGQHAASLGVAACLQKPLSSDELLATVERFGRAQVSPGSPSWTIDVAGSD